MVEPRAVSKVARMADLMVAWMARQRVSQKVSSKDILTVDLKVEQKAERTVVSMALLRAEKKGA